MNYLIKSIIILLLGLLCSCHPRSVVPVKQSLKVAQQHIKEQPNPSKGILPIVFYVNFSLPSTEKRFVIKQGNKILYSTWVAHGAGSGRGIYARTFSNASNSYASSLGVYRVVGYNYRSHHGVAIKLKGLSKTNSNAYTRLIEIHSAKYIGYGKTGHSAGCFAVTPDAMKVILKYAKIGTELIAYR